MKAPPSSAIPKASKVLGDLLGWKYPFSQKTWNVTTLKRSGAGNTLFLAPPPPYGCLWFSVILCVKDWYFLFCLAFSFTLYILLPCPFTNILMWQFGGDGGIIFLVVQIYSSLYLISLSEPGSIYRVLCTSCWIGLGNEGGWNCCTRVICQILKHVT